MRIHRDSWERNFPEIPKHSKVFFNYSKRCLSCFIPRQFRLCWCVLLHELRKWVECSGDGGIDNSEAWKVGTVVHWICRVKLNIAVMGEIDGSLRPGVGKLTNNQSWEINLTNSWRNQTTRVGEIDKTELGESKNSNDSCGYWWPSQPNLEFICPFSVYLNLVRLNIAINLLGCWNRKLGAV